MGLGFGEDVVLGEVVLGAGDADFRAELGGEGDEGVADVVAVAEVGHFESVERASFFEDGEKVGHGLAGGARGR